MTQEEILDYNKRCAEFLGGKYIRNEGLSFEPKGRWYIDKFPDAQQDYNLKFHSDWNWIMELKNIIINLELFISPSIHRLYFNVFACRKNHKEEFTYKVRIHSDFKDLEFKTESNDEKEAVVQAINQFLIWYNEIQTNKQQN